MTDGTFTMKIDPETETKLIELATEADQSKSAVIRTLIRSEHKRVICVQHADGTREIDPDAK